MKKLPLFALTILVIASCSHNSQMSYYGDKIEPNGAISSTDFLAHMNNVDSSSAKVEARIIETCSMKGCWMTVDLGDGKEMRVTFEDYSFFVPKDSVEGRAVIFEGVAKKTVTSVAMQKHYAQDAGKSAEEIAAITEPKEEISFVATGVAIKDVQE